jgi:hypothetical protein
MFDCQRDHRCHALATTRCKPVGLGRDGQRQFLLVSTRRNLMGNNRIEPCPTGGFKWSQLQIL